MTRDEARQFCDRWLPLWTGNQPAPLAGIYAEDVTYRDPAHPEGIRGREALFRYFRALLSRNPAWTWTAQEIHLIDGGFTLLWKARIPAGDIVIEETGMDWVFVKDGQITRNEVYFDRSALVLAMGKEI